MAKKLYAPTSSKSKQKEIQIQKVNLQKSPQRAMADFNHDESLDLSRPGDAQNLGQYSSLETAEQRTLKINRKSPKREDLSDSVNSSPKKYKNKMSKGNFES